MQGKEWGRGEGCYEKLENGTHWREKDSQLPDPALTFRTQPSKPTDTTELEKHNRGREALIDPNKEQVHLHTCTPVHT